MPNLKQAIINLLAETYHLSVRPSALFAYIAAIAAHPGFTARFQKDLATPGIRIPLTADSSLFQEAVAIGERVIWLHTFGERMADAQKGRSAGPPRLPEKKRPKIPKNGTIPTDPERMPAEIRYDADQGRLWVGEGYIDNVPVAVWNYEVSGKQTVLHWFSYRKKNRERPRIGDKRPPSPLNDLYPDRWLPEYTTELINLLNVLGLLIELEPQQADLLDRICSGSLLSEKKLQDVSLSAAFGSSASTSCSSPSEDPDQLSFHF